MPFTSRLASFADARLHGTPPLEISIPAWHESALESIMWADVLGPDVLDAMPLTRATALKIPAVARARHLVAGTIARLPLLAYRGADLLDREATPAWCYATDGQLGRYAGAVTLGLTGGQSPWQRMLGTIDDQFFYGGSLWLVTARAVDGRPARMVRIPFDCWTVDDGGAYADPHGRPLEVDVADLVYLPGAHEGLLTLADVTLRQAASLERTATDVARHPFRLELHQTTETPLSDPEIAGMVSSARRAMIDTVGVLFTNSAIETKDHAIGSGDLLIAGRNQTALDVARHASMPATMLDAVATGASLTYETAVTRNQQWLDYGLAMYLDAVQARLSMDDIVPIGQRISFDVDALTSLPALGPTPED